MVGDEVVGEGMVEAFVFWEPNCDPGRFGVMPDAMKLHNLVIAAYSLWKRHKQTVARNHNPTPSWDSKEPTLCTKR
jgi:hypothetical protein